MPMLRKLAVLAAAAEAARRYAKKNPDQASKYVDQAADFVDKQTKGKYRGQITGAANAAKSAAGIKRPGTGVDSTAPTTPVAPPAGPATSPTSGPVTP
jgi:hypothetical protein